MHFISKQFPENSTVLKDVNDIPMDAVLLSNRIHSSNHRNRFTAQNFLPEPVILQASELSTASDKL
jgi:hypothetical protein